MEQVRLIPPGEKWERGAKARLYVRWMPHLGAEVVALYELLRVLPDVGQDSVELEELAELLRSTPENVEASLEALVEHGFAVEREGWVEVLEHPPVAAESWVRTMPGEGRLPFGCPRERSRWCGRSRRGSRRTITFALWGGCRRRTYSNF